MCAALPGTLQQALRLQKNLGPRVAPVEVVIADKVLVEVLGGETAVAVAIQSFDLLFAVNRHPFARRPAEPAVQQTGFSGILKPQAPAAKRPLTDPKQLSRFQLIEFARFITAQYAPELDHSHTLVGFRPAHPSSPKSPVSPDRSCAT